jgi:hypothetical protein
MNGVAMGHEKAAARFLMPAGSCVLLSLLVNRLNADFGFAGVSMQSKRSGVEEFRPVALPRAARSPTCPDRRAAEWFDEFALSHCLPR